MTSMNVSTNTLTDMPVVIFGEALVDEFSEQSIVGGAPFNVARNLACFSCSPLLVSRIGQDEVGAQISAELQRSGMLSDGVQMDVQHASGRVKVWQDQQHDHAAHRFEILADQAYDYIDQQQAVEAVATYCQGRTDGIFYFGSLIQRSQISSDTLQELLKRQGMTTFLDLNLRDGQASDAVILSSLQQADIVKLNEDELQYVLKLSKDLLPMPLPVSASASAIDLTTAREAWGEVILPLLRHFSVQSILITLGERGYAYFDQSGRHYSAAELPQPVQIVDTVGAGDAFAAVFLLGLVRQWPLAFTLQRAHQFATRVCGVRGAVATDIAFYQDQLRGWEADVSCSGEAV
ncbi:PfkB family carbohydrate kinase [Undibacterium sp. SXout7W]|uniref:PfkB family carbohydrate kinase n=1 Tax=Undibacterium sp. SXout7W TaxID=3413049 RepID=UPI003BF3ACCE